MRDPEGGSTLPMGLTSKLVKLFSRLDEFGRVAETCSGWFLSASTRSAYTIMSWEAPSKLQH